LIPVELDASCDGMQLEDPSEVLMPQLFGAQYLDLQPLIHVAVAVVSVAVVSVALVAATAMHDASTPLETDHESDIREIEWHSYWDTVVHWYYCIRHFH